MEEQLCGNLFRGLFLTLNMIMRKSLLAVFLINILGFTIRKATTDEISEERSWLYTKERVEYLLDKSVNPCEDFFSYACSRKNRGKKFPYAREKITQDLTKLVEEAAGKFSFVKVFYDSCLSIPTQFSTEDVAEYCTIDGTCTEEQLRGDLIIKKRENFGVFPK